MVTVDELPPAPPRQDDDEPTAEDGQVKPYDFVVASTLFLLQEDNAAVLPPASPRPVDVLQPESQFAAELDAEQVSSRECIRATNSSPSSKFLGPEKLCLNLFSSSFEDMRDNTDMTLACEDCQLGKPTM